MAYIAVQCHFHLIVQGNYGKDGSDKQYFFDIHDQSFLQTRGIDITA